MIGYGTGLGGAGGSGAAAAGAGGGGLGSLGLLGTIGGLGLLGYGGYEVFNAIKDAFKKDRPVDVYKGTMGNIGPNQLIRPDGNGNWLHYGYSKLGHHDAGRTWQDMQGRALDDYNYAHGPMDNGMTRAGAQFFQPGLVTHMPGQGPNPSPLGPASGISAALAPYFAGQPYAPPVGIGTTPGGR